MLVLSYLRIKQMHSFILHCTVQVLTTTISNFIMVALCNRADHYIFILFLSSFFLRLISAVRDWMSTTHGVALVRI